MRCRVVLATGNPGKIRELRDMLSVRAVEVLSLADVGIEGAEETGTTFEENATLKAVHAAAATGSIAVADDSGIEVDALGGAPGVRSARYAGDTASDEANRDKLLAALGDDGGANRAGRFVCVIAVAHPSGTIRTFRGMLDGNVARAPRGAGGFGYDPVLELPDGRTVAELSVAEKNRISHRSIALAAALPYLEALLGSVRDPLEG